MKTNKTIIILLISIIILQSCKQTANWNQYLGPDRNAVVKEAEILRDWGEKGPKEMWSYDLGEGYGAAAIYDGEVFILDREKGKKDILRCIAIDTGDELWNFSYDAEGELAFPGSRVVPTVDENYVWSAGPHGDLYCIDKKTHKALWNINLKEKYASKLTQWGYSQAPLIYNNLVIMAPHGDKAGVVAFDKETGEIAWESRPLTGYSYHASPTLGSYGGVDQVIMISPYDRRDSTKVHEVVSFDANSGEELWTYDGLKSFASITPPVVVDEKRLFFTDCSYNGNYAPVSIMVEVTKGESGFIVKELFLTEEAGCKMHPAVFFEDHIYLNSNGRPNQMYCLNMDGKVMWNQDSIPGFEMGGMILIGDLIVNQNGKNGDIHLIEPSPDGYRELGKATFFDSKKSQAWAPIAYYDGKIIIRDMEKMVCVDLSELAI